MSEETVISEVHGLIYDLPVENELAKLLQNTPQYFTIQLEIKEEEPRLLLLTINECGEDYPIVFIFSYNKEKACYGIEDIENDKIIIKSFKTSKSILKYVFKQMKYFYQVEFMRRLHNLATLKKSFKFGKKC